jgi:trigger factor
MATQINRLQNGTIEIHLVLPWTEIQNSYEKEVLKAIDEIELPGFRKGKAPREMVEPKLDKDHLYSDALESILPKAYSGAIKEHSLKPLLYPHIKVVKSDPDKDWEFDALICETPEVDLKDYQVAVKKVTKEPKEGLLTRILDQTRFKHRWLSSGQKNDSRKSQVANCRSSQN